jgi:hypothetical protein
LILNDFLSSLNIEAIKEATLLSYNYKQHQARIKTTTYNFASITIVVNHEYIQNYNAAINVVGRSGCNDNAIDDRMR